MKLAVAALIRNEIDIIDPFLRHLDALFDDVLLMDHGSVDGTERVMQQACAGRPGWTFWHLDPVGYHQTAFSQFALGHLLRHTDVDIAMLLDADEFIDVPDRARLHAAFAILTDPDRIGLMHWCDIVPARFDQRMIQPGEPIWRPRAPSRIGKMVIPRIFWQKNGPAAYMGLGNHGLYYDATRVVPTVPVGQILHLPIRSHLQLRGKVLAGALAVMSVADRVPTQAWHWFDLLGRIADDRLRDEDLIGIAAGYSGQRGQVAPPLSWPALAGRGYTRATLDVPFGPPLRAIEAPPAADTARLVASILRRFTVEDPRAKRLVLDGNRLRFVSPAAPSASQGAST